MADDRGDFIAPPWWKTPNADYTKHRTGTSATYDSPDKIIGRRDTTKYKPVTSDPATDTTAPGDVLAS